MTRRIEEARRFFPDREKLIEELKQRIANIDNIIKGNKVSYGGVKGLQENRAEYEQELKRLEENLDSN